jgi:hypothetical protein
MSRTASVVTIWLRQATRAVPPREIKAKFIEPTLLLRAEALPQGLALTYELKLNGYRAIRD